MTSRIFSAVSFAGLVTLTLFWIMSQLALNGGRISSTLPQGGVMDFIRVKDLLEPQERERALPKKPEPPKKPPVPEKISIAEAQKPAPPQMKMEMPQLNIPLALKGNAFLGNAGAGAGAMDGQLMPIVRIEPQYPRRAAMEGQEGWVTLQFDITEAGTVSNVDVIDSHPRKIFDSEAKRALLKWRYKPGTEEGKPVAQLNNKVRIDFKLR